MTSIPPQPDVGHLMKFSTSASAQLPPVQSPAFHFSTSTAAHSALPNPNEASACSSSVSTSSLADDGASSHNTIFPRRKAGERTRVNSKPVVLNDAILRQLFTVPLHEAAVRLGISATAMKSGCRKLGIKKWPYRSSYGVKNGGPGGSGGVSSNCSDTSALTSPSCSSISSAGSVRKFPDSLSCKDSTSECTSEDCGDERREAVAEQDESLTRDAVLLAETMLMIQQGTRRASPASKCGSSTSSATSGSSNTRTSASVASLLN